MTVLSRHYGHKHYANIGVLLALP